MGRDLVGAPINRADESGLADDEDDCTYDGFPWQVIVHMPLGG